MNINWLRTSFLCELNSNQWTSITFFRLCIFSRGYHNSNHLLFNAYVLLSTQSTLPIYHAGHSWLSISFSSRTNLPHFESVGDSLMTTIKLVEQLNLLYSLHQWTHSKTSFNKGVLIVSYTENSARPVRNTFIFIFHSSIYTSVFFQDVVQPQGWKGST